MKPLFLFLMFFCSICFGQLKTDTIIINDGYNHKAIPLKVEMYFQGENMVFLFFVESGESSVFVREEGKDTYYSNLSKIKLYYTRSKITVVEEVASGFLDAIIYEFELN